MGAQPGRWYTGRGGTLTPDATRLTVLLVEDYAVPILVVSRYAAFAAQPDRAQRAGCDAVLQKPCSPDVLERSLRSLATDRRRIGGVQP